MDKVIKAYYFPKSNIFKQLRGIDPAMHAEVI